MKLTLAEKIIKDHLISGEMIPGREFHSHCYTLTQDSTEPWCTWQYEAISMSPSKQNGSVRYIDHNMLQTGPRIWMTIFRFNPSPIKSV